MHLMFTLSQNRRVQLHRPRCSFTGRGAHGPWVPAGVLRGEMEEVSVLCSDLHLLSLWSNRGI